MVSILLINQYGNEVQVNETAYQQIVDRGEEHLFHRQIIKHTGDGEQRNILLDLRMNGIGDDIHAMPAIAAKIAQGFKISVIGRAFTRLCFISLGCSFIPEGENEPMMESIVNEEDDAFGIIYSLKMWTHEHEWDTKGICTMSPMEQFAKLIEVELPKEFDWKQLLVEYKQRPDDKFITLALTSSSKSRTYQGLGRVIEIIQKNPVMDSVSIGTGKCEYSFESFKILAQFIYDSKLVVAVESGILVLALALGKSCIALLGKDAMNKQFIQGFLRYRKLNNVSMLIGETPNEITPERIFQESIIFLN